MDDAERRRMARAAWPGRRRDLAEEGEALVEGATPAELIAMVDELTLEAWAMAGRPLPVVPRGEAPGRLIRWTR